MKKIQGLVLAFVVLCSTAFAQQKYVGWSTGYLPNYANFSVSKVNFKCYNFLVWFSISGNSSGVVSGMSASDAQTFTTTCHTNNTKAIICVGGGGAGSMFTSATTTNVLPTFITNLVSFMQTNKFDGIDIDWEDGINTTQYANLFKGLAAAFDKITPRPLLTVATGMGLAQYTVPVAQYIDQLNLMSYYGSMTGGDVPIPQQLAAFTSKGVAKNKLGIGYGYDTDNEIDGPNEAGNGANGNPSDINAKCKYTVDSGYGGIMVWEVDRAPKVCDSVTAFWVNKTVTAIEPMPLASLTPGRRAAFTIVNNGSTSEIRYSVPTSGVVSLELFNMMGARVQSLAQGMRESGVGYVITLGRNESGRSVTPGMYVLRMATPESSVSGTVVVK